MIDIKLRVCHYPQIPCEPFIVEVKDLEQAKFIYDTLANYDLFQYENNIKPDYANATVVEQWDDEGQEWLEWMDEETGIDDINEYFESLSSEELGQRRQRVKEQQFYYWIEYEKYLFKRVREKFGIDKLKGLNADITQDFLNQVRADFDKKLQIKGF